MLYAALIWTDSPAKNHTELSRYEEFSGNARSEGVLQGGQALHDAELATTVRFRDDEVLMTDGPFLDSKEQIHGFMLFECDNLNQAIAWAAKIPGAQRGAIEVRPVLTH